MKPVCLVIGAGAGIGGTVGKRFAQENYHAVLCRRSNEVGLKTLVSQIQEDGGDASGFLLNAVDEGSIEERIAAVESGIGPIELLVFNLGAQVGNRSLEDTSYKVFELGWRMATSFYNGLPHIFRGTGLLLELQLLDQENKERNGMGALRLF